ncbi:sensor histidine kinase [Streptomyces vietnamensis]|uniref:sensor histidine kinase n=1 Tax=Streptomyces vietnamensis TaxID=362257 RepID=UPI00343740A8
MAVAAMDVLVNVWDRSVAVQLIGALAWGAVVFCRRFPLSVFLLTLPADLLLDIVFPSCVALFVLAERSRNRRLLAVCAVTFAVVSAAPWPLYGSGENIHALTLVDLIYSLATAAAPVFLGQLLMAQGDLARRVEEIEEAREHERMLHAQAVLARERAQLAREMHDVVSHQVGLIAIQAGALQVSAADPELKEGARTIRSLSVETLNELRHMVTLLRASGGRSTELTPQPTLADLHKLVATSGIEAELTGELPAAIDTTAQRALYRTVQEALTNVRKHAPGAKASVRLWNDGTAFGVTVTNTAATRASLPLPGSHHGLVGLRERAELLHGELEAGSTSGGGYRLALRIPRLPD